MHNNCAVKTADLIINGTLADKFKWPCGKTKKEKL